MLEKRLSVTIMLLLCFTNSFTQPPEYQVNLYSIPIQGVSYIRHPARDCSQEVDAVYFNPAATTGLENGGHLMISNLFQFVEYREKVSDPVLPLGEEQYVGTIKNYIFPTIFAVYKKNKWALNFGFEILGGGGGYVYDNLSSAELPISEMANIFDNLLLEPLDKGNNFNPGYSGIDKYQYNFSFGGQAYTPSFQTGVTYELLDYLSAHLGFRYLTYIVNIDGQFNNIQISIPQQGGLFDPSEYLKYIAEKEMDKLSQIESDFFNGIADFFDDFLIDRNIKVNQFGHGWAPIIGLNFNWQDKYYLSAKYEHRIKVNLKTNVVDGNDGGGIYEDNAEIPSDLPGFITFGARLKPNKYAMLSLGVRNFFFKRANFNGREKFANSSFTEYTFATELGWREDEKFKFSVGASRFVINIDKEYQNEVNFILSGFGLGGGIIYKPKKTMSLELGVYNTFYRDYTYYDDYELFGGQLELNSSIFQRQVKHELSSKTLMFAVGATFHITKKKNKQKEEQDL